jgi:hypothetical protein
MYFILKTTYSLQNNPTSKEPNIPFPFVWPDPPRIKPEDSENSVYFYGSEKRIHWNFQVNSVNHENKIIAVFYLFTACYYCNS